MLTRWQGITAVTACATLVAFTACGKGNRNNADTTTAATSSGDVARADSAATATAPGGAGATAAATTPGSTAASTSSMKITGGDSEILQVLAVVDQGEVQDGQLAQKKARHAQVKSYARELITDHSKSLQQDREIAKTAKIDLSGVMMSGSNKTSGTPKTGSDTSRSAAATAAQASGPTGATGVVAELVNMHTQSTDRVRQLQGAAFDSAFMDAQVQGHQQVLSLLQSAQSQAQNSSLQQHVAAAIKGVQSHLEKGQQLQQSLASGASGSPSDTTSKSKSKSDTGKSKSDTCRRG
jgi:putative membrane protein